MSFKTLIDLSGQKYGRLTVLKRGMNDNSGKVRWICKCDCGNEKLLRSNDIRSGKIVSCGCYMKEVVRNINITHNMNPSHQLYRNRKTQSMGGQPNGNQMQGM